MTMTWGEFKAKVDAALLYQGKDDSIEISYIDITYPENGEEGAYRVPGVFISNVLMIQN